MSKNAFEQASDWIVGATYIQLLHKWRFGESDDPCFEGTNTLLFKAAMNQRYTSPEDHTAASKLIGWTP